MGIMHQSDHIPVDVHVDDFAHVLARVYGTHMRTILGVENQDPLIGSITDQDHLVFRVEHQASGFTLGTINLALDLPHFVVPLVGHCSDDTLVDIGQDHGFMWLRDVAHTPGVPHTHGIQGLGWACEFLLRGIQFYHMVGSVVGMGEDSSLVATAHAVRGVLVVFVGSDKGPCAEAQQLDILAARTRHTQ